MSRLVKVGDIVIGDGEPVTIAGPCSVESKEQIFETAKFLKEQGCDILRGGAFKPRTSPKSFQGLGVEGLRYLKEAGETYNMPIISELMDTDNLDDFIENVDIIQIGSRNMQNFSLLKELSKLNKPVMLKRGLSATIEEWVGAVEYLAMNGNTNIILCERGIRTFDTHTRNTFDVTAIPIMKKLTGFPIIADPSHATGVKELILPVSLAAMAGGADGIMIEVHPEPDKALSDGQQSLNFNEFDNINSKIQNYKRFIVEKLA